MADVSQQPGPEQVQTNGLTDAEDDERGKARPADIDADMREMERRKRVEMIMGSRLFREELERILDGQLRDGGAGGASGLLQRLGEMMGVSAARMSAGAGAYKSSNCVLPINDIRGVESMGYAKGEKILRCKLAAAFRLMDMYGWSQGIDSQITARLNADQELFLVNPYGLLYHEVTASSLVKANMQGAVLEQGTTNFGINLPGFLLHSAVHASRPDIRCVIHVACPAVLAVSALRAGLLPVTRDAALVGEVATHQYIGGLPDAEERDRLSRSLGPVSKVLLLSHHGAVCCGETVEEAFYTAAHMVAACEAQLRLMPAGVEQLALIPDETRKQIYEASRRAPDNSSTSAISQQQQTTTTTEADGTTVITTTTTTTTEQENQPPSARAQAQAAASRWRIGGPEFEALMRMLDNAGYRTGYIYRQPLVKGEPPRPKNEVEVPPAVSSLGYLLEEEEMYRQGIWKKLDGRKGHDRTRWLNSPNVYQKVEILETGTPDPKKITKWVDTHAEEWVADGSPTHSSTPVKIDAALQFVPKNTNPKEFKQIQQQIKDYRRADKISAGPQSQILEGATWDEARRLQDAGESHAGDAVVLLGAASKGIIQRGFQHNAAMYKAPYARNPFDAVTDDEINEYKKTVERKAKGDYDTDFSESEALSSMHLTTTATHSGGADKLDSTPGGGGGKTRHHQHHHQGGATASETEEESRDEPRILRIETRHAPKPSQPEVVLSDEEGKRSQDQNQSLIQNQQQPRADSALIEKRLVQERAPVFVQTATRVVSRSEASISTSTSLVPASRNIITAPVSSSMKQEDKSLAIAFNRETALGLTISEELRQLIKRDLYRGTMSCISNSRSCDFRDLYRRNPSGFLPPRKNPSPPHFHSEIHTMTRSQSCPIDTTFTCYSNSASTASIVQQFRDVACQTDVVSTSDFESQTDVIDKRSVEIQCDYVIVEDEYTEDSEEGSQSDYGENEEDIEDDLNAIEGVSSDSSNAPTSEVSVPRPICQQACHYAYNGPRIPANVSQWGNSIRKRPHMIHPEDNRKPSHVSIISHVLELGSKKRLLDVFNEQEIKKAVFLNFRREIAKRFLLQSKRFLITTHESNYAMVERKNAFNTFIQHAFYVLMIKIVVDNAIDEKSNRLQNVNRYSTYSDLSNFDDKGNAMSRDLVYADTRRSSGEISAISYLLPEINVERMEIDSEEIDEEEEESVGGFICEKLCKKDVRNYLEPMTLYDQSDDVLAQTNDDSQRLSTITEEGTLESTGPSYAKRVSRMIDDSTNIAAGLSGDSDLNSDMLSTDDSQMRDLVGDLNESDMRLKSAECVGSDVECSLLIYDDAVDVMCQNLRNAIPASCSNLKILGKTLDIPNGNADIEDVRMICSGECDTTDVSTVEIISDEEIKKNHQAMLQELGLKFGNVLKIPKYTSDGTTVVCNGENGSAGNISGEQMNNKRDILQQELNLKHAGLETIHEMQKRISEIYDKAIDTLENVVHNNPDMESPQNLDLELTELPILPIVKNSLEIPKCTSENEVGEHVNQEMPTVAHVEKSLTIQESTLESINDGAGISSPEQVPNELEVPADRDMRMQELHMGFLEILEDIGNLFVDRDIPHADLIEIGDIPLQAEGNEVLLMIDELRDEDQSNEESEDTDNSHDDENLREAEVEIGLRVQQELELMFPSGEESFENSTEGTTDNERPIHDHERMFASADGNLVAVNEPVEIISEQLIDDREIQVESLVAVEPDCNSNAVELIGSENNLEVLQCVEGVINKEEEAVCSNNDGQNQIVRCCDKELNFHDEEKENESQNNEESIFDDTKCSTEVNYNATSDYIYDDDFETSKELRDTEEKECCSNENTLNPEASENNSGNGDNLIIDIEGNIVSSQMSLDDIEILPLLSDLDQFVYDRGINCIVTRDSEGNHISENEIQDNTQEAGDQKDEANEQTDSIEQPDDGEKIEPQENTIIVNSGDENGNISQEDKIAENSDVVSPEVPINPIIKDQQIEAMNDDTVINRDFVQNADQDGTITSDFLENGRVSELTAMVAVVREEIENYKPDSDKRTQDSGQTRPSLLEFEALENEFRRMDIVKEPHEDNLGDIFKEVVPEKTVANKSLDLTGVNFDKCVYGTYKYIESGNECGIIKQEIVRDIMEGVDRVKTPNSLVKDQRFAGTPGFVLKHHKRDSLSQPPTKIPRFKPRKPYTRKSCSDDGRGEMNSFISQSAGASGSARLWVSFQNPDPVQMKRDVSALFPDAVKSDDISLVLPDEAKPTSEISSVLPDTSQIDSSVDTKDEINKSFVTNDHALLQSYATGDSCVVPDETNRTSLDLMKDVHLEEISAVLPDETVDSLMLPDDTNIVYDDEMFPDLNKSFIEDTLNVSLDDSMPSENPRKRLTFSDCEDTSDEDNEILPKPETDILDGCGDGWYLRTQELSIDTLPNAERLENQVKLIEDNAQRLGDVTEDLKATCNDGMMVGELSDDTNRELNLSAKSDEESFRTATTSMDYQNSEPECDSPLVSSNATDTTEVKD